MDGVRFWVYMFGNCLQYFMGYDRFSEGLNDFHEKMALSWIMLTIFYQGMWLMFARFCAKLQPFFQKKITRWCKGGVFKIGVDEFPLKNRCHSRCAPLFYRFSKRARQFQNRWASVVKKSPRCSCRKEWKVRFCCFKILPHFCANLWATSRGRSRGHVVRYVCVALVLPIVCDVCATRLFSQ